MSDTAYPVFQHYGTNAQRLAFTPAPAAGTTPLYIWYETDTDNYYIYTTAWKGPFAASTGTVTHTGGALTLNELVLGAGGADIKTVAATDGQIPIGKSSDGTVTLGTITAGTGITVTNGAASITLATSGATSGLVLLEQHTASASASLDFTTAISGTYDEYLLEFVNIVPATNGDLLWMRCNTGAGFDSGANYSHFQFAYTGGASTVGGANGATKIVLTLSTISSNTSWGITGTARFYSPGSASLFKQIHGELHLFDSASTRARNDFAGTYEIATAVTQIQFLFSTGNIASGTIRMYGIAK